MALYDLLAFVLVRGMPEQQLLLNDYRTKLNRLNTNKLKLGSAHRPLLCAFLLFLCAFFVFSFSPRTYARGRIATVGERPGTEPGSEKQRITYTLCRVKANARTSRVTLKLIKLIILFYPLSAASSNPFKITVADITPPLNSSEQWPHWFGGTTLGQLSG